MKYCTHCGKELPDEAILCIGCGCAVGHFTGLPSFDTSKLVQQLSQRININGIIWLVIGILQIFGGIFFNWFLLIVGVLNIISALNDISYSKTVLKNQSGIVSKFEPLAGSIITLVYNLVIGGVIGVIGSIYYFVQIRNFVMENKIVFESLNN